MYKLDDMLYTMHNNNLWLCKVVKINTTQTTTQIVTKYIVKLITENSLTTIVNKNKEELAEDYEVILDTLKDKMFKRSTK